MLYIMIIMIFNFYKGVIGYVLNLKDKYLVGFEWVLHNPPKPHAFSSTCLQSSIIQDKVEDFEKKSDSVPNADELEEEGKSDPRNIRDCADKHLAKIEKQEDNLLREIEEARLSKSISEDTAEDLINRTQDASDNAKKSIKEANDVAIDMVDDTIDTQAYTYNLLPMVLMFEISTPLLELVKAIFITITHNSVRPYIIMLFYYVKTIITRKFW